ncbi:putative glycolipid-binding domain-containing protein [Pedobacter sp. V48]|uniref:putative glycolipid-binding domain-containing protein n=1 Tax=Pedobacter sp. V48 TaxID=509635 RepID=UPI0003E56969|nr:putative glycolipid-binding domain-containing protein [Pedobacter sp. V48]ETZ22376.1 hypothetical protein N824_01645 [Pedobacter sp. V48]
MRTTIIWKGIFYQSLEHCVLTDRGLGYEISSTINGSHKNQIFKTEYHIKTNKSWETEFLTLRTQLNDSIETLTLEKKQGRWLLNDRPNDALSNIFDIDLSLSPLTNTLPINRLQLKVNQQQTIEVLYFDILKKEIRPVKQLYTRKAIDQYLYENYDKSFISEINIDEQGLVTDYPKLFKMTNKHIGRII